MVHGLPIPLTHIAPINHNDMPFPKNVHGKDLPCGCLPKEESHPQKNLSPPNALPREKTNIVTSQDTIEGFNNEQPFFGRGPPRLVLTFPSLSTSIISKPHSNQNTKSTFQNTKQTHTDEMMEIWLSDALT